MKLIYNLFAIILLTTVLCMVSCSSESKEQEMLDRVDSMMEAHPDSALMLLSDIDKGELSGKRQKAQYALLMSMALDKNYIDTTTFDVLQPAIDYYLEKGTADEKLRTLYYEGRIFQNQGNRDSAMKSYMTGLEISRDSSDSLTIARTMVATGLIYNELFDIEGYMSCSLKAAEIYGKLSQPNKELDCLYRALNGAILSGKESLGDSIINHIESLPSADSLALRELGRHKLSYALKFGMLDDIDSLIRYQESNLRSTNDVLNLALAYSKLGNNQKAIGLLDYVKDCGLVYDTLRYLSIAVPAFEGSGDYKGALSSYKQFSHKHDSIDFLKFDHTSRLIEERHQTELKAQKDARYKSLIIWGCAGGIAILILVIIILLLLVRSNRAKKELALEKVRTRDAENAVLKSENDNLSLENRNLQLERDKKSLEAENLAHRVEALENESDSLKALIGSREELPPEVQREIKVRIEMLNSLLASYVSKNDQYGKSYEAWIKQLADNKDEFMNSNRLAFQVSHPRFIKYFEDHGLTTDEINYVCLYAIGLKGKEVGKYMNKTGHVNTSSAIRRKLGIDKHETNIGIYVRKLLKSL